MIITYLRSSSIGCYDLCAMQYYGQYVLGWKSPSNIKAEKGTIVHKVLELLATIKLNLQNKNKSFDDDIVGKVYPKKYSLSKLTDKCFEYYSQKSKNNFTKKDYDECVKWVDKAVTFKGGLFDPRNNEIVKAEQSFDFEIHQPWAMYEYELPSGEKIDGFLALKGTIDQVSKLDDNTYMILDWKTGRRWNWATDEEKTYGKLCNDPQLMMYYYAAQHLYPEVDNIQVCIYFINDGGEYDICFTKRDIPRIEDMLRGRYEAIKATQIPSLNKTWKCSRFCHFGTTTFEGTSVKPIVEHRSGQITPKGKYMTKCEQIKYCLEHRPENVVREHMTAPNFSIDTYDKPGE